MTELKPCPFCGSTDVEYIDFYVACNRCSAMGPSDESDIDIIKAWNTRTPPEEE
jgi:Lar family restriction alleviation protein